MKIVHTYIKTKNGTGFNEYTAYSMLLSVLLAKKHYERVELYCNQEIHDIVREIGIPYTNINVEVLEDVNVDTFSIPKLMVYSLQEEPFIHIDLDTFLFNKLPELDRNTIWGCYPEGSGEYIGYTKNTTNFFTTYLQGSFKIQNDVPEDFLEFVKFKDVMNMCVFGGYNFSLIKRASQYCLEIYNKNKEFFDSDYYYSCIIEQLFIPSAVRYIVNSKLSARKTDSELFTFFFDKNPTLIHYEEKKQMYPFIIESNKQILNIKNRDDIFKNISYNFNGFLHLNGYKTIKELMFLVKQKLIQDFGAVNEVIKIDRKFNEVGNCLETTENYMDYLQTQIENINKIKNGVSKN